MSLTPRNWGYAVFLWLSLATVLVPAVGSFGPALQRASGSAFSAFTSDVSLGPSRGSVPQKDKGQQAPTGGGDPVAQAEPALAFLLVVAAPPDAAALERAPPSAGALPQRIAASPFRARAPPLS